MAFDIVIDVIPYLEAQPFFDRNIFILVDVLRTSSTIITALANGAQRVVAVGDIEEAKTIAKQFEGAILAGERFGVEIPTFDLNNSPAKLSKSDVKNKTIVLTTTNGTRAINAIKPFAKEILIGALINTYAVANVAKTLANKYRTNVTILAVGRIGKFAIEDWIGAGLIASRFEINQLTERAKSAAIYANYDQNKIKSFIESSETGKRLKSFKNIEDVEYCSKANLTDVVPIFSNGAFVKFEQV